MTQLTPLGRYTFLLLTATAIGSIPAAGVAATYFVDSSSGSDGNPGTQKAPFRTVSRLERLLRPGDTILFKSSSVWNEILVPPSGDKDRYVTYGSYGKGEKPRLLGFRAEGKSFIKVSGLAFRNSERYQPLNIRNDSHHIVVNDCDITADTGNQSNAGGYIRDSHHITVTNSRLAHLNLNHQGDALILQKNTRYCLIANNEIGTATHYSLTLQGSDASSRDAEAKFNVIRDNIISNKEGALVELQSNSNDNLVEGNLISGGKSVVHNINIPTSFKNVSKNNIVRFNIVKDNTTTTSLGYSMNVYTYRNHPPNIASGNHTYNNVITNISKSPMVIGTNKEMGTSAYNNFFKNNVVYNNHSPHQLTIIKHHTVYDNFFTNNIFHKQGMDFVLMVGGTAASVTGMQNLDGAHFTGNLQQDPKLDTHHLPMSGSPCIDGGDFLTRVTSASGRGKRLSVADAGYFSDGFGIVDGDTIRVGEATATVVSVDRDTNTLTLAKEVNWKKGAPVSLPYDGARPDIGIAEYRTIRLQRSKLHFR